MDKNYTLLSSHLVMSNKHVQIDMFRQRAERRNLAYFQAREKGFPTKGMTPTLKEYKDMGDGTTAFPRFFYNWLLDRVKPQVIRHTSDGDNAGKCFEGIKPIQLRPYQFSAVKESVEYLDKHYGLTLNALMGTGKTVAGLEIARRMRFKTLVLVHTEFLMKQWQERSEAFLGFTPGIIQGDVCDTSQDITIAMMQTLNARDYSHLADTFGLIIVDEVHRAAAPVFSSVIQTFNATYRLGLTATAERLDGTEWIFFFHIGPPDVTMVRTEEFKSDPKVYMVPVPSQGIYNDMFMRRGNFQMATYVTALGDNDVRTDFIVEKLADAARNGRRIVVFSDRKAHLNDMAMKLEDEFNRTAEHVSYGFMVGGMTEEQRQVSQKMQVIFCTFQLASEGLDIPELDVAFLTTPKKNVQQAVGRIERALEGKKQPIVMDFVDKNIGVSRGLAVHRYRYYKSRGWEVAKPDWIMVK